MLRGPTGSNCITTPVDLEQLADLVERFNGNLAREAGRWIGCYHFTAIPPEPEAFVDRLNAVLSPNLMNVGSDIE